MEESLTKDEVVLGDLSVPNLLIDRVGTIVHVHEHTMLFKSLPNLLRIISLYTIRFRAKGRYSDKITHVLSADRDDDNVPG